MKNLGHLEITIMTFIKGIITYTCPTQVIICKIPSTYAVHQKHLYYFVDLLGPSLKKKYEPCLVVLLRYLQDQSIFILPCLLTLPLECAAIVDLGQGVVHLDPYMVVEQHLPQLLHHQGHTDIIMELESV